MVKHLVKYPTREEDTGELPRMLSRMQLEGVKWNTVDTIAGEKTILEISIDSVVNEKYTKLYYKHTREVEQILATQPDYFKMLAVAYIKRNPVQDIIHANVSELEQDLAETGLLQILYSPEPIKSQDGQINTYHGNDKIGVKGGPATPSTNVSSEEAKNLASEVRELAKKSIPVKKYQLAHFFKMIKLHSDPEKIVEYLKVS